MNERSSPSMASSRVRPSTRASCAVWVLLMTGACTPKPTPSTPLPPVQGEGRAEVKTGTLEPHETRDAPYPPARPSDRVPNPDDEKWPPVPDGPVVGNMRPANPPVEVKQVEVKADPGTPQP